MTKALAVEFSDEGESIYKSNIYFLDLEDIFNIGSRMEAMDLHYSVLYNVVEKDYYLTRKELVKKRFLVNEINNSYTDRNVDKLKYMYFEMFGEDDNNIEKMHDRLIDSLDNNYNYIHENIYNLIKIPNV